MTPEVTTQTINVSNYLTMIAVTIVLLGAIWDVRKLEIPNSFPLALSILFVPFAWAADLDVLSHAMTALTIFLVVLGLFAANLLGGGDAKLMTACALWAGPEQIGNLIILTALSGGVLATIMLFIRGLEYWNCRRHLSGIHGIGAKPIFSNKRLMAQPVPYGVAIAVGTLGALALPLAAPVVS